MRQQILDRFNSNAERVGNLLQLYQNLSGSGQGRRPVHATDILRSAVVLLHAALEDMLRSVGLWKLPGLGEGALNEVPLVGLGEAGRAEKFFLGKLAPHRAKSVQSVIEESVRAAMNRISFNSVTDIAVHLQRVGLERQVFQGSFPALAAMIERRHHIVHQADRNDQPGTGHFRARSLSIETVKAWATATNDFVTDVLQQVPDELV